MRPGERHVCAECQREATEEREVEGLIVALCPEHAAELDKDRAAEASLREPLL